MKEQPLRTAVMGSYPFPGWLEFASQNLEKFGTADVAEAMDDAVVAVVHDQISAGVDVITDGELGRREGSLSFYSYLEGIEPEGEPARRFGPPAHDQRGKHRIKGELRATRGLGAVEEFERLKRLAPPGVALKVSLPGPYTLSGRLGPNDRYRNRYAITEGLLPIVRAELEALVRAGCREITLDEPSMTCFAHKEDVDQFVAIFNRTVQTVAGKCRLSTHLCFGNLNGRSIGPRRYGSMFPSFLEMNVDEIHVEMASREFSEIEIIAQIARRKDVAVGIVDVKSFHVESPDEIADRVRLCLKHAPANRLSFAPDCGLSQTARWAAKQKLKNMVEGVKRVRKEIGV